MSTDMASAACAIRTSRVMTVHETGDRVIPVQVIGWLGCYRSCHIMSRHGWVRVYCNACLVLTSTDALSLPALPVAIAHFPKTWCCCYLPALM